MMLWDMLECLVEVPRASGEFRVIKRIKFMFEKLQIFRFQLQAFLFIAIAYEGLRSCRLSWAG